MGTIPKPLELPESMLPTRPISQDDFDFIRKIAYREAGISIADYKYSMVFGRICKRMRKLGFSSVSEYIRYLKNADSQKEIEPLINVLTTNKTSFFREPHHFDHFADNFMTEFLKGIKPSKSKRLRVWSAGCSSGEEAYSLAMVAMNMIRKLPHGSRSVDFKLLATDIDTNILERAKLGNYPKNDAADIPVELRQAFLRSQKGNETILNMPDLLREVIAFNHLNLIGPWPMRHSFDAIFCRDVAIYFNKDTQRRLYEQLTSQLSIGGYLYIGHSESIQKTGDNIESVGHSIYRRTR